MTNNNQTIYETINYLDTVAIVSGSEFTFNFITNEINVSGQIVSLDLTGGITEVKISYLGIPEPSVITLTGTITDVANGVWNAVLGSDDTIGLSGVFTYQAVVTDFSGKDYIPGQGQLVIMPRNV